MRIGVIGTGYVGLTTGTCFAETGNDVMCIDINEQKVAAMQQGQIPIYEPGLEDMFTRNINEGRLHFSTNVQDALGATALFLALPTPSGEDGSADLSYVLDAARDIGPRLTDYTVIVDKSTVPVGTADKVHGAIAEGAGVDFDVVSNPEFLREGQAINDFMHPERVVIGSSSDRAAAVMHQLYKPFVLRNPDRIYNTDVRSAEMIKYAANAILATRISFMNQLSGLCEAVGADIESVRLGIGSDSRIGNQFLYAGPGYGGSCFPKDVLALMKTSADHGLSFGILDAVQEANDRQKQVIADKVKAYYKGNIQGRTFAVWGLAFKDNTDDIRESPALAIVDSLTAAGAKVVAFDPEAMDNVKRQYQGDQLLEFADEPYAAVKDADALVIATNWREFSSPDFSKIRTGLKEPIIFDGRNMYDLDMMRSQGIRYESIGRECIEINDESRV